MFSVAPRWPGWRPTAGDAASSWRSSTELGCFLPQPR
jgi:hypothetical protein